MTDPEILKRGFLAIMCSFLPNFAWNQQYFPTKGGYPTPRILPRICYCNCSILYWMNFNYDFSFHFCLKPLGSVLLYLRYICLMSMMLSSDVSYFHRTNYMLYDKPIILIQIFLLRIECKETTHLPRNTALQYQFCMSYFNLFLFVNGTRVCIVCFMYSALNQLSFFTSNWVYCHMKHETLK